MLTRLNPVALPGGEQKHFHPEFQLGPTLPIVVTRIVMGGLDVPSPLGPGTITNLDAVIRDFEDDLYELVGHTEMPVHFEHPPPQLFSRSLNGSNRHLSLEPLPRAGLLLRDRDLAYTFHRFPGRIWRIVRIEDLNRRAAVLERNVDGLMMRLTHPDGLALDFTNGRGGLRQGYDVVGLDGTRLPVMRYAYDGGGRLAEARASFGESWTYERDEEGRQVAARSDGGTKSRHRFDEDGRVVEVDTEGTYKHGRIEYAEDGRTVTVHHGDGREWERFEFDERWRNTRTTAPDGGVTERTFDELNDETAVTDPNGHTTRFEHDAHGNLQSVTDPAGRETFMVHDDVGRVLSVTDHAGASFDYGYDMRGNLVSARDPLGHLTDIRVNEAGQPLQVMRHDGLMEVREHDEHHRLVSLTDHDSAETRFAYDAFHRPTEITDPQGRVTRLHYDDVPGRPFATPSRITRPDGVEVRREFTAAGRMAAVIDGEGRLTRYHHGPYGVLEAITDPRGHRLAFEYDARERLTRVTNQLGLHWTFERDACGRVVRETDFDGRTLAFEYDPGGRVIRRDNPDGGRIEYDYDPSDRLTEMRAFEPGSEKPWVTTYAYDEVGRLARAANPSATIELERDALGRIVAEGSNGHRIESEIDCCGRRTRRRMGEQELRLDHTGTGRLRRWELDGHAPLSFERDPLGRETRRASPEGFAQLQEWDEVGQLAHQWAGMLPGATSWQPEGEGAAERRYGWTRAYEPAVIRDALWGETRYEYDARGQIARTRHGDGGVEAFRYGADLNIEATGDLERYLAWETSAAGVVRLARGPRGEVVRLEHDSSGRVVRRTVERRGFRPRRWTFRWNALDQMVGCTTPEGEAWSYAYDPFGRRVSKSCGARRTAFVWDGDVPALVREDGPGGTSETEWFFEPEGFVPMARREAGRLSWVVVDHLGTPKELVDEAGRLIWAAAHDTWGAVRASRGGFAADGTTALAAPEPPAQACPLRFQGQWEDEETGLCYNRFRYYDPVVGQYSTIDPLGVVGGASTHAYVKNPHIFVDYYGLTCNLPHGQRYVYRALARGEDIAQGLHARCCSVDVSPESHVGGARETNWISATLDPTIAHSKYNRGHGVVSIDLCKVDSEVVDVSGGNGFVNEFVGDMAREDAEVLIREYVPPAAIKIIGP